MDEAGEALVQLGRWLREHDYQFVTPTPETHRRVLGRHQSADGLRDVFGWSLPFSRSLLPGDVFALMQRARVVEESSDGYRSLVRFSSLRGALFVHSAYPTVAADSVFFGPDTYRFCSFLSRGVQGADTVVDIGCGSGAGGIVAAEATRAKRLVLTDINPRALRLAAVNVELCDVRCGVETCESDVLTQIGGHFDLIIANPPYMRDAGARTYRDGGGAYGEALSARIVRESLPRLEPGGRLLLYTGTAVIAGQDIFWHHVQPLLQGYEVSYDELDPDVFGEELDKPGYERVERIAAVGLRVQRLC